MKFKQKRAGAYELDARGYAEVHLHTYALNALKKTPTGKVLEILFDDPESYELLAAFQGRQLD